MNPIRHDGSNDRGGSGHGVSGSGGSHRRALLFDLDGTLCDTLPLIYDAFREVLLRHTGRRYEDAEIRPLFGPPEEGVVRRVLTGPQADEALQDYLRLYQHKHAHYVPVFPERVRDLAGLRASGLPLGIITGKGIGTARISLRETGLEDLFDIVLTGSVGFKHKPAPDGLLLALRALGVGPDRAAFVGDSLVDIQAGKAAGCTTVGVLWQDRPDGRVRAPESGADHLFDRWDDFIAWAREWAAS